MEHDSNWRTLRETAITVITKKNRVGCRRFFEHVFEQVGRKVVKEIPDIGQDTWDPIKDSAQKRRCVRW
jgi:hypothetical protein